MAAPCPTPTHMVVSPDRAPLLFISCNNVAEIRTPLHPSGCPIAIAPPFTFTLFISRPRSRIQASDCEAKASLSSIISRSAIFNPALCNAFFVAGTGPMPITEGSTPATAMEIIFANGCRLYFFTASSPASKRAAAPSLMPDELPAVTVPSFINAGFKEANFSSDVSLGCSSVSTIIFSICNFLS